MTKIRFDHFITYTSAANIDDYLKEYKAQGFVPYEETVRHDPGLRNGFIGFGPEYIEFGWVEDEALFAAADMEQKLLRTTPRPFGIGMLADDVQAVHNDWTVRGYSVPAVWSKAPRDAAPDTPSAWSFQAIPGELVPGVSCFALTYHARPHNEVSAFLTQRMQIKIPPNTIYAVSGVTFVATEPKARAIRWRDLLAPGEPVHQSEVSFDVWIGPHQARWMTPDAYQATYALQWRPFLHPGGELALLHLLASDLSAAKRMLEQSERRLASIVVKGEEELLIAPDARDGFTFIIRQQSVEIWLRERMVRTGEKLQLAQD